MTEIANATSTLTPHIVCDGAAEAIEFYKKAFGAEELMRLPGPDGRLMHGAVAIHGHMLMLVDENKDYGMLGPKALGGSPVTLHLNVPDVDASFARAVEAGATVKMPVADQFWGDRYGLVQDPFGHNWSIATPLGDKPMTADEFIAAAPNEAQCGA